LTQKIIFLSSISDLNVIPEDLLQENDMKIFSFDFNVHEELNIKKIKHEIADNLLTLDERLNLFDKIKELESWHSNFFTDDFNLEKINLLKIFDRNELLTYILLQLINFKIIKKILEKEKPIEIIATTRMSKIIQLIIKKNKIKTKFFENRSKDDLFWDKVTAKYNLGGIPLTFSLSRKKYLKLKSIFETLSRFYYNFWYKFNNTKKNTILFLEFNPQLFSKLFHEMKNYDGNVILINQRRSAISTKKSIEVIKQSNCKILKLDDVLNKHEKSQIPSLVDQYSKKIHNLWDNSEIFSNIFQIDGYDIWDSIKDVMIRTYSERLFYYISLILSAKKIINTLNIKCIVSLNESGETEKAIIETNNKKFPTILLEHGFIERIPKTKRFDLLSEHINFNDKILVWGESKKHWLVNEYDVDPKRIIVNGSPRHDDYFLSRLENKKNKEKILLLAPNPINDIHGQSNTNLKIEFNEIIKKIFEIIKTFDNVKIIVKLHPIQLPHNEEIKLLIRNFDSSIPIYLWTPVIDTINSVDAVLVLTPEIHATPTMLLESMILGKPTMNIYFDKTVPEFEHIKNNAVFTMTNHDNLEDNLKKFLFDDNFQNTLQNHADNFVNQFMSNPGTASEKFASILKSY
jgi:hypothetical protein